MFNRPYLYLAVITIMALFSCGKSDNPRPETPPVDSLYYKFMIGNDYSVSPVTGGSGPILLPGSANPMAGFTYQAKKPVRRSGGILTIAGAGGYMYMFSPLVYDTVVYNGNHITITTHYNGTDLVMAPNQRDIELENGRIKWRAKGRDTVYYYYGSDNRITRTESRNTMVKKVRTFEFDSHGNLNKTTRTTTDLEDNTVTIQEEETFTGYDTKANPLKNLWQWDDLYYRSLSANNFTGYSYKENVFQNGKIVSVNTQQTNITLYYTTNGQLDCTR